MLDCYAFAITCSYDDEVLRFKVSAVHAATKQSELRGISDNSRGLVQTVADNFDATISSPNGLQSTHNTGLLLTQMQTDIGVNMTESEQSIKRMKKKK